MAAEITPQWPGEEAAPRIAPFNTEAEQGLLGAILLSNPVWFRVSEFLKPEYFGNAVHGRIYAAISELIGRGEAASPVSLKPVFDADPALQTIGGSRYLFELAQKVPLVANAEGHARACP